MTGQHRLVQDAQNRSAPIFVVVATGAISLINYSFSLLLLYIFSTRQYGVVASASALLLVFGSIAGASAPWVLAREVAISADDPGRRQRALAFSTFVALGQAAIAALACTLIVASYADWQTTLTASGSATVIFLAAAAVGYLQGIERFSLIYCLRAGEVIVKVSTAIALVKLGMGTWGALSGFAFGALLVLIGAFYYMRDDVLLTWRSRSRSWVRRVITDRRLWSLATGIIGIQAGTAIIVGLDLTIASVVLSGQHQLATYQVAQILGRVPFYVASALAVIVFPRMARLRNQDTTVMCSLHVWVRICGAATIIVATLPFTIITYILPVRYGDAQGLLPWAAMTGFSLGGINLVTTYWQATNRCKRTTWLLFFICIISGILDTYSLHGGHVLYLAWAAAATSTAGLLGLLAQVRHDWPMAFRGLLRQFAIVAIPGAALLYVRDSPVAWMAVALIAVGLPALRGLRLYGLSLVTSERPRVLHLAFEDPLRPGAGGGSVRTFEIDRRLALSFHVTVVAARYPGSKTRLQDGVRYVHIGLPWGQKLSLLSYFVTLPWALLRYSGDLVVEDFAAPFSSVAVPWMTSRPVVGVVQWLFAEEKASEYGLPFHLIERVGLSSHRHLVAVSDDLGAELRRRNPKAQVSVISNGLPEEAFMNRDLPRKNILYLGRLDIAQKGLDILVQAFASIADHTDRTLTIAGSGPDEERIRSFVRSFGLDNRVAFIGQVAPEHRFDLLASAELVAMPSRYETFGMVAAESLAVGTPVVGFNIPCLRSLVPASSGILVSAFDTREFASAMFHVLNDPQLRFRLGNSGKMTVRHLQWDGLAATQQELYSNILVAS